MKKKIARAIFLLFLFPICPLLPASGSNKKEPSIKEALEARSNRFKKSGFNSHVNNGSNRLTQLKRSIKKRFIGPQKKLDEELYKYIEISVENTKKRKIIIKNMKEKKAKYTYFIDKCKALVATLKKNNPYPKIEFSKLYIQWEEEIKQKFEIEEEEEKEEDYIAELKKPAKSIREINKRKEKQREAWKNFSEKQKRYLSEFESIKNDIRSLENKFWTLFSEAVRLHKKKETQSNSHTIFQKFIKEQKERDKKRNKEWANFLKQQLEEEQKQKEASKALLEAHKKSIEALEKNYIEELKKEQAQIAQQVKIKEIKMPDLEEALQKDQPIQPQQKEDEEAAAELNEEEIRLLEEMRKKDKELIEELKKEQAQIAQQVEKMKEEERKEDEEYNKKYNDLIQAIQKDNQKQIDEANNLLHNFNNQPQEPFTNINGHNPSDNEDKKKYLEKLSTMPIAIVSVSLIVFPLFFLYKKKQKLKDARNNTQPPKQRG
ncbi:MAG: hypothetical protein AAF335_00465 [Bacteroidota bacterium]